MYEAETPSKFEQETPVSFVSKLFAADFVLL